MSIAFSVVVKITNENFAGFWKGNVSCFIDIVLLFWCVRRTRRYWLALIRSNQEIARKAPPNASTPCTERFYRSQCVAHE